MSSQLLHYSATRAEGSRHSGPVLANTSFFYASLASCFGNDLGKPWIFICPAQVGSTIIYEHLLCARLCWGYEDKLDSLSSWYVLARGWGEGVLDTMTGNFYVMPRSSKHREAPDRVWGHQ